MADLSHWDLADTFTGSEAAYLMMGVDPSDPEAWKRSTDHVLRRLERARDRAHTYAWNAIHAQSRKKAYDNWLYEKTCLYSEVLDPLIFWLIEGEVDPLEDYLSRLKPDVADETFSRKELARWVRNNNVPSIYRFDLEASVPATPSASGATVPQAATPAQGTADDTPAATAAPNSRERNTLLRIIGGLAMATYKMNIHGRMDGITEILEDLAQHGVTVSEETLRGKLREAARLIDPPADNKG